MAPFITCVNNLSKAITNSTIKVRCVRAYQGLPEDKNDRSSECVFHDSKVDNLWRICNLTPYVIGVITGPGRVISQSKYRLIEIEISDEKIRDDSSFLQQGSVIEGGQRLGGEYDDLQVKSLEDLSCLEEGSCWVFGKIESVECHYGEWYFLACKTCVKKVREVDNKFNCSGCTKTHSYAVKRFKFVVNVVDHTSNASLLLWDREDSQLLGRSVTDFLGNGGQVAPKNSIPALIEEILVGQNVLFKLQLKNHIEYYRSYPFTVNKVCNLPEVVDKYTPTDLGEQIFKFDTKLSDLLFGADLAEVSQKPYATTDLSSLGNENISDLFVEGSELNVGVVVAEGSQKVFDTPDLSTVSNDKNHGWGAEGSVKRCLDLEFDRCADVGEVQMNCWF
ncbi:hypothetical protein SASPL_135160 [Salvia splendens]|uniref:Replication factor A C-terminal domain-containing protein n=1 Tax=Salvia splendens TaxID=180675 RepID=A0A8X8WVZ6_SALSN|nr:hypothetical protein SASPL_135160 [Salvia splendens]